MADSALAVDDTPEALDLVSRYLTKAGFNVVGESDGIAAVERLQLWTPDVIVTDYRMPGMDGLSFLQSLDGLCDAPAIMLTNYPTVSEAALDNGATLCLNFRDIELIGELACQLVRGARAKERRLARETVHEDIRAKSRAERDSRYHRLFVACEGNVHEMARRVGKHPSTVRYHLLNLGLL